MSYPSTSPTPLGARSIQPLPPEVEIAWRTGRNEPIPALDEEALPFSLLLAMMGGSRPGPLPSHSNDSLPRRFEAPISRPASALVRGSVAVSMAAKAGPSVPMRRRPRSAPANHGALTSAGDSGGPSARDITRLLPGPPPQPPSPPESPLAPQRGKRGASRSHPSMHSLDRALQKEFVRGTSGHSTGHLQAPRFRPAPTFWADLSRERAKTTARGVNMGPHTLRVWEAHVERAVVYERPNGLRSSGKRSISYQPVVAFGNTRKPPPPPQPTRADAGGGASGGGSVGGSATLPMSAYEMRRFLQRSGRFFMSVAKDKPFAMPSHTMEGQPIKPVRAELA